MICRYWEARATAENADKYQHVALTKVIPGIEARDIPGFLQIDLLRYPLENGDVKFVTLAWFENEAAIEAFSGHVGEESYLPTEITEVLSYVAPRATHFEVVDRRPQPRGGPSSGDGPAA